MTDIHGHAATLQRAAQVLDNAASNATPGQPRWHARPDSRSANCIMPNDERPRRGGTEPVADLLKRNDAAYTALVDPTVGKAWAAWLRSVADTYAGDPSDYCGGKGHLEWLGDDWADGIEPCTSWWCENVNHALTIARALLRVAHHA